MNYHVKAFIAISVVWFLLVIATCSAQAGEHPEDLAEGNVESCMQALKSRDMNVKVLSRKKVRAWKSPPGMGGEYTYAVEFELTYLRNGIVRMVTLVSYC